jgi:hypothetical protein
MRACRCRRLLILACLVLTVAGGCDLLNIRPRINEPRDVKEAALAGTPGKFSYRLAPYVFLADFDIPRNSPIFRDLAGLRDQVYRELRLPPSNTIVQVYLFEDRERYESFMQQKYPYLPKRRAFFVAQPRRLGGSEDLLVYTYWGERIQQDLRHELTHALLHSVLKDVPLWLDEGLAEFFEVPTAWDGVNIQHLEQLRAKGAERPNLARLEQLSEVEKMTPADYREAWAWTHLMLRSTPGAKKVLIDTLQELRSNPRPGPLRPRLADTFLSLDEAIDRHLADLASKNAIPAGNSR